MPRPLKHIETILLISVIWFSFLECAYSDTKEPAKTDINTSKDIADKGPISLELLGTVIETDPAKSIAVIKNLHSKTQGTYKVADKILGYQIVNILRGRVTLLKDGKISFLDFPLGSEFNSITIVSSDKRIINREAFIKKIPDLNTLMQQGEIIPYIKSGKIIGLRITKIKDKTFAMMSGLMAGDIVTSVNGQQLNSLHKPLEIYNSIRGQERVDIEIKRDDKSENLTYYINNISR